MQTLNRAYNFEKIQQNDVEVSLIVPMHNEEDVVDIFFTETQKHMEHVTNKFEFVCVNDGSTDRTLESLLLWQKRLGNQLKIVNLSRNFGKEAALTAGLDHSAGQAVVPIDADLQDPPQVLETLVAKWRSGFDVVYAVRRKRESDSLVKAVTARCFYRIYNKMSSIEIPANAGDFRLMDRRVVESLRQLPERNRFMKGLLSWPGYRNTCVFYDREPRAAGVTKWNYWKLWNFALDGVTSFSTVPLRIWSYVGALVASFAFVYGFFLIVRTLLFGVDVPGYASLMVVVLFLGGIQLITLGIIGEYLGRTYIEVKGRPIYLVRDLYGFERERVVHEHEEA